MQDSIASTGTKCLRFSFPCVVLASFVNGLDSMWPRSTASRKNCFTTPDRFLGHRLPLFVASIPAGLQPHPPPLGFRDRYLPQELLAAEEVHQVLAGLFVAVNRGRLDVLAFANVLVTPLRNRQISGNSRRGRFGQTAPCQLVAKVVIDPAQPISRHHLGRAAILILDEQVFDNRRGFMDFDKLSS